jgi:P-type Cu+ transporter
MTHDHHEHQQHGDEHHTSYPLTAIDPVCGMQVDRLTAKHHAAHNEQTYYFCSTNCRSKFVAAPDTYLTGKPSIGESTPGAIYTCPMHPEIRQAGPGSCPICGMALEPTEVSLSTEPSKELTDMTRRFWIGLIVTAPVFILEMGGHLIGLAHLISAQTSNWIQLSLATPVVWWAGWPFFAKLIPCFIR